jgi:hypothetical protein
MTNRPSVAIARACGCDHPNGRTPLVNALTGSAHSFTHWPGVAVGVSPAVEGVRPAPRFCFGREQCVDAPLLLIR